VDYILRQGVLGAIIGATLGSPFRGQTVFRRIGFYEPIPARMSASEALDAWIVAAKHVGAQRPADLTFYSYRNHWHSTMFEAAFGRYNLDLGFSPPLSGAFRNPLANGSGALGRAAVYGILFHGDPAAAIRHAVPDASIDHSQEGVVTAAAIARMVAMAQPGVAPLAILRAGLEVLPEHSTARRAVTTVVQAISTGKSAPEVHAALPTALGIGDPLHAGLSFGYLALALLAGNGRFGPTVSLAAGCGGAASAVAIVAGTLAGLAFSAGQDEWVGPLGTTYVASSVLRGIDLPTSIDEFVSLIVDESVAAVGLAAEPVLPVPARGPAAMPGPPTLPSDNAPETDVPTEPACATDSSVDLGKLVAACTGQPEDSTRISSQGLEFGIRYLESPIRWPQRPNSLIIQFSTNEPTPIVVDPKLTLPEGWTVASRLTSCRVSADAPVDFPAVLQGPKSTGRISFELSVSGSEIAGLLLPAQNWMVCGPFVNHDGRGFEQTYKCEDILNQDEVFNGRSDLPVKWTEAAFPGIIYDLEPHFRTGPGTVYLYARVKWAPGARRIVVATSPGTVVTVNRKILLRYHDTHFPAPRAVLPYVAEFESTGEDEILVKVLRNREVLSPVVMYFLDSEGRIIEPDEFVPMP